VRDALHRLADGDDDRMAATAKALLTRVPIPPAHHVRIEVLGPARLLRDGEPITDADWRRARVRQMVCALVALREVRRARLGALLWPEFDEKGVSSNLRMTLSYVQNLLEPHRGRGDAPWFLQQDGGVLRLRDADHLTVDAWELERALDAADEAAAAGSASTELGHLLDALELWHGDYLDDVAGEDWAEPLRERVRQRFVRGAVRAGELLVAAGRPADAVTAATAALAADPWCEAAIRVQVGAHLASGDRTAARHAYDAGCKALADLGVSPEPATTELAARI
jgi:DNA-binding SARP family transcriptional activator